MTSFRKWSEVRADIVANSGGEETVAEARRWHQAYIDHYCRAERAQKPGPVTNHIADEPPQSRRLA
ncbi:hypothetical protein AB0J42_12270 [Nonomuraea sp. NPDC049649]|uniref:hypothetical protein n=1 Tax=Nonomuraea sp. NPDC049649 TaxID=3155776 RepID=UPI003420AC73